MKSDWPIICNRKWAKKKAATRSLIARAAEMALQRRTGKRVNRSRRKDGCGFLLVCECARRLLLRAAVVGGLFERRMPTFSEILTKLPMAGGAAASGTGRASDLAKRSASAGLHRIDDGRFSHLQAAANHRISFIGRSGDEIRIGLRCRSENLEDEGFSFVEDNHRRDSCGRRVDWAGL